MQLLGFLPNREFCISVAETSSSLFRRLFYSQRGRLSLVLFLFAVIPTLFSSSLLLLFRENEMFITKDDPWNYFFFFAASVFTMSFALTPTTFFAIISGYFFQWKGLPGVLFSYIGAMVVGMLLGKKLNAWFVGGFIAEDEKLKDFFGRLKERNFLMIVLGRLSPHLPFAMMNVAFASMKVPWGSYLAGSFIGMLPRTLLSFYLGMNVTEIYSFATDPRKDKLMNIATIGMVLISTAGIIWLVKNALQKESTKPGKEDDNRESGS